MMKFNRNLKSLTSLYKSYTTSTSSSYKVLVVGGGTAGISVAAKLSKKLGKDEVAIIEPSKVHNYQPLWTLVGAGIKTLAESQKPTSEFIPTNANWIQHEVSGFEPEVNKVVLKNGEKLSYEYLVVATGVQLDYNKIKGLKESLGVENVSTNYAPEHVEKTFKFLNQVKEGNVLFTQPSTPIKCAGAPQKIAYLANDILLKNNVKSSVSMKFLSGLPKLFAIDKYAQQLHKVAKSKNIDVHLNHDLIAIDSKSKVATFKTPEGEIDLNFSFLHVTPPMGPIKLVKESQLVDANGYVDVDRLTLRSTKFHNIFSLGDCSNLPTSKTAAAITQQSHVLARNLLNQLQGKDGKAATDIEYDGYTSCPLFVGEDKLILAEFSGYTSKPLETFGFDQSEPSKFGYWLTKDVIPEIYWNYLLKGSWNGPKPFRNWLNPTSN